MSAHQLPAPGLLAAFAATAVVAWAAAGRRRGAPTIAGAMLFLQGALHLLFSMTGAHPAAGAVGDAKATTHAHAMTGGHPSLGSMHPTGAMQPMGSAGGPMGSTDPVEPMDLMSMSPMAMDSGAGMLAVHLLAALLCGLWLAHGEAAFFTLAEAALAYAFTPLRLLFARVRVPDAPRGPVRRPRGNAHRPHTVVLAHTVSRRGPPRLSVPRATALGAHV
ncbi:hypothetical protein [Streptomyces narbonensis]|uniref:hypothetical protein n=1 Tax=Streptomyces narbonensis TaxID=67333 RepID=UPI0019900723|nr:hypothetical protein [Streptomyces narbonensis]GGV96898.1 hypothetical protein GCM10010230_16230 [Streptomyces narbonensis]